MADIEGDDPPYKAEYAKSGRAGCKLCKGNISKDSLRLAKMVQSPFFDGKQPNWYHYSCFFKTCKPQSTAEVSGFTGLRPADQDRLRGSLQGSEATEGGGKGGKGKGRVTTRADLSVEYAKSSRSSCHGCHSSIEKGEVRVSKMEAPDASERGYGAGLIPRWHHLTCFLERATELEAECLVAEELSGFTKLKKEDQKELKSKFRGSGKKTGKKRKGESEALTETKKSKLDQTKQQLLREQGDAVWKVRDKLQAELSTQELKQLLEANGQTIPSGESKLLDACADGMLFGALKPCPECKGQLVRGNYSYLCTGNLSSWTKCVYSTTEPDRSRWTVPAELREEAAFLKKYKYKAAVRVFEEAPPTSDVAPSSGTTSKSNVDTPLQGFSVFIIGRLSRTKAQLTQTIRDMGGKVVTKVTKRTTICLSSQGEVEKMSVKMKEVESCDVPVVDEVFLENAETGGALLKIPSHTISGWGAPRHALPSAAQELESAGPSVMKLTVKGSSAVDPDSGLDVSHHVLEEGGVVFNAVLGLVDIRRGTNSYYKLQLLEGDSARSYHIFRKWGRVGTSIGGSKLESYGASKATAKAEFASLFLDKTGNDWEDRGENFVKKPNKFYPLEIDYSTAEEGTDSALSLSEVRSKSSLHPAIQDLVRLFFDVESMRRTMMEFEVDMKKMPLGKLSRRQMRNAYSVLTELQQELAGAARPAHILDASNRSASPVDMKKMPLGKLSRRQMRNAYSVLTELQQELAGAARPAHILDASNRFYTLIPHDFGLKKPPLLDSEEIIKAKTQMVDSLLEIEVAYSLLQEEQKGDPIDANYSKLKTDLQVLDKEGEEFLMIQEYVGNTHGSTHSAYSLEVLEVFTATRQGERKCYKPFSKLDNRMLLWHGSRTTNYAGILSQGLRIAPPEAPVTGYMFGKGVYFADMVTKSANYCRTSPSEPVGVLLLCEVALGDMYELKSSEFITELPAGKHSTKGVGRTAPDPAGQVVTETGVVVPKGKGRQTGITNTSLLYNEFIVYDVAQINIRYLLKCNFKYNY